MIEKRGWNLLSEHKPVRFVVVVREFFANLVGKKEKMRYIRGKWISFDGEEINKTYNLEGDEGWIQIKKVAKRTKFPKDSRVSNLWEG